MVPTSLSAEREVDQLLLKDNVFIQLFIVVAQSQVDTKFSSFLRATSGRHCHIITC